MAVSDNDDTIFKFYIRDSSTVFSLIELLIFALKRERRISRLSSTLELVIMSTNAQHVTLKSPKMSNDYGKQSNYRLMNVLCRTKAMFADFSKSPE